MSETTLRYGVRMSVLFIETDYEPGETFRHPTEPCNGCERLVIGSKAKGPIMCEECLNVIVNGEKHGPADEADTVADGRVSIEGDARPRREGCAVG